MNQKVYEFGILWCLIYLNGDLIFTFDTKNEPFSHEQVLKKNTQT